MKEKLLMLLEAKRKLYSLLLELPQDEITDNETDMLFSLSKDEQIQTFLKSKI